jgi:phage major head subunit gpT-like protein
VDVTIFTAAMRQEFLDAYEELDPTIPAPWEDYTTEIPSNARIENYAWLSPAPGVQQYQGHRRLGLIDWVRYSVANLEYDSAFEVLLRDIEDDQVGGYKLKPAQLAKRMKLFPGRAVLKQLPLGTSTACFDGTNFFASSHTLGSGNNTRAFTASGASGTYYLYTLVKTSPVKPLIWQTRKAANFENDAGTPASKFAKKVRYWSDMEGAAAYGYWWDAHKTTITNLPTSTDIQTLLGLIENDMRTFTMPKAFTTDDSEYPHEQMVFNADTVTFAVSTGIGNVMRQVLNQDTIVQSGAAVTNLYKGYGKLVVSAFLN